MKLAAGVGVLCLLSASGCGSGDALPPGFVDLTILVVENEESNTELMEATIRCSDGLGGLPSDDPFEVSIPALPSFDVPPAQLQPRTEEDLPLGQSLWGFMGNLPPSTLCLISVEALDATREVLCTDEIAFRVSGDEGAEYAFVLPCE